jgi:hypothetical protein
MASEEDAAILRIGGGLGCCSDERPPTVHRVEECSETKRVAGHGQGSGGCQGGWQTPLPVSQEGQARVAVDGQAVRPEVAIGDGSAITVYENGAKRSDIGPARYDLIPGLHEVALAMGEGGLKFGENNWRGLDPQVCVNHAIRHLYLWLSGDRSENHASHAACNCLMIVELEKHR